MNGVEFIRFMQLRPPVETLATELPAAVGLAVTECRMDGVLLGSADIEINHHEAIYGICAGKQDDA